MLDFMLMIYAYGAFLRLELATFYFPAVVLCIDILAFIASNSYSSESESKTILLVLFFWIFEFYWLPVGFYF